MELRAGVCLCTAGVLQGRDRHAADMEPQSEHPGRQSTGQGGSRTAACATGCHTPGPAPGNPTTIQASQKYRCMTSRRLSILCPADAIFSMSCIALVMTLWGLTTLMVVVDRAIERI